MYFQNECTLFIFIFHKGLLPVEFFLFYYMCNLHDTYVYVCTSYIWGRTFDFQLFFLSCLTFVSDCVRGCLFCVCMSMSFLSCAKTSVQVYVDMYVCAHLEYSYTISVGQHVSKTVIAPHTHKYSGYQYMCTTILL